MSSYIPAHLRRLVTERAQGLCEYCLIHDDTYLQCQIEHIIAEKHGGPTSDDNLALACVFCNRAKGTDIATVLPPDGRLSRLYSRAPTTGITISASSTTESNRGPTWGWRRSPSST